MADDWFNEDPFDSILKDFFGERSPRRTQRKEFEIANEEEDRLIDFIEAPEKVFVIFELPGYSEKDIAVAVKDRKLEVQAQKRNNEGMQDYLAQKLRRGEIIKKSLPDFINTKKFSHTFKNGILEVALDKK